jgi:hypothetical protein
MTTMLRSHDTNKYVSRWCSLSELFVPLRRDRVAFMSFLASLLLLQITYCVIDVHAFVHTPTVSRFLSRHDTLETATTTATASLSLVPFSPSRTTPLVPFAKKRGTWQPPTLSTKTRSVTTPSSPTSLFMASGGGPEELSEQSYTEAAWGVIAALPKAADYYQTTNIEAPILFDVLLNPAKHSAGDNALAAQRVADKCLQKANIDTKLLRSELENYLAQQPKMSSSTGSSSSSSPKTIGSSLGRVLDVARNQMKSVLGDSFVSTEALLLALARDDDKFTREALRKQGCTYQQLLSSIQATREKSGPAISRGAEVCTREFISSMQRKNTFDVTLLTNFWMFRFSIVPYYVHSQTRITMMR